MAIASLFSEVVDDSVLVAITLLCDDQLSLVQEKHISIARLFRPPETIEPQGSGISAKI